MTQKTTLPKNHLVLYLCQITQEVQVMKKIALTLSLLLTSGAVLAQADSSEGETLELMQTGRYTHIKNIPPVDQLNPLKVVVTTRIPQSIKTVGDTVIFLLARSGYELAEKIVLSEEANVLLKLPLPQIHRDIGPMTLDQALKTLSGEAFVLVVDPVHRKVGYELSTKLARKD